jgi:hypothetical protein
MVTTIFPCRTSPGTPETATPRRGFVLAAVRTPSPWSPVRDEEALGSNPATPTKERLVTRLVTLGS